MNKITITIEQELTNENINDLVSTCIEGSSWVGWVVIKKCPPEAEGKYEFASDIVSLGGTLEIRDSCSTDRWELTLENMLKGIQMHCTNKKISVAELMDDYDADDADCIVQYALFNELVFC
jgi:hypothetical protein